MTRHRSPPEFYREPKLKLNESCRKLTYENGAVYECGAPTKGKVYCPACAMHLITMLDRKLPVAPKPKKHKWRETMWPRRAA